jgi:hypothetical protein
LWISRLSKIQAIWMPQNQGFIAQHRQQLWWSCSKDLANYKQIISWIYHGLPGDKKEKREEDILKFERM